MRRVCWIVLPLLLLLPACRAPTLTGESVGQYGVTGTLVENTCGEGYPAPDTFSFFVEIRHEADLVGYWKLADAPLVSGTVEREGDFRFVDRSQVVAIPNDVMAGVAGCALEREEVVAGTLLGAPIATEADVPDGGAPEPALPGEQRFEGTTTIAVTPTDGDCTPLLGSAGGPFGALPCAVRFDLAAEQLAEPLW